MPEPTATADVAGVQAHLKIVPPTNLQRLDQLEALRDKATKAAAEAGNEVERLAERMNDNELDETIMEPVIKGAAERLQARLAAVKLLDDKLSEAYSAL